jgi:hypothetical protein
MPVRSFLSRRFVSQDQDQATYGKTAGAIITGAAGQIGGWKFLSETCQLSTATLPSIYAFGIPRLPIISVFVAIAT